MATTTLERAGVVLVREARPMGPVAVRAQEPGARVHEALAAYWQATGAAENGNLGQARLWTARFEVLLERLTAAEKNEVGVAVATATDRALGTLEG